MLDSYNFGSAAEQAAGGQNITANAGAANSTNEIDLGALIDDRGTALSEFGPVNGNIWLVVTVGVAPDAGTGIKVKLQHATAIGGSYSDTEIGIPTAIAIATLTAGYVMMKVPLPPTLKRALKLVYTTTGDHSGSAGRIQSRIEYGSMSHV